MQCFQNVDEAGDDVLLKTWNVLFSSCWFRDKSHIWVRVFSHLMITNTSSEHVLRTTGECAVMMAATGPFTTRAATRMWRSKVGVEASLCVATMT
jgi:hypothetical protein